MAAIIRCATLHMAHQFTDIAQEVFWNFVEAGLALLAVPLNATRPLLATDECKFQISKQNRRFPRVNGFGTPNIATTAPKKWVIFSLHQLPR